MDSSQVLALVAGWVAVSVPVSFVIGGFMALGSRTPQRIAVPVSQTLDRTA
jgi:hypothetical protein